MTVDLCMFLEQPRKSMVGRFRRTDQEWKSRAYQHDSSDQVESLCVVARVLAHVRDQRRPQQAGQSPRRQHQPINGADISRTEEVGGKGRHGAEAAAVTQQDDEGQDCESSEAVNSGQQEKDDRLRQKHHLKYPASADEIRKPGPQKSARAVCDRDDSNQTRGRDRRNMSDFLRHGRSLGNDRDAGAGVQKENGPQAGPLPRLESRSEGGILGRAVRLLADRRMSSTWAALLPGNSPVESRIRNPDAARGTPN